MCRLNNFIFRYNIFEGTGFLLGARLNRRLSNIDTYSDRFKKWIPAAHLGIFTHLSPRIRLDATVSMDIPERVSVGFDDGGGMRDVSAVLNVTYQLK